MTDRIVTHRINVKAWHSTDDSIVGVTRRVTVTWIRNINILLRLFSAYRWRDLRLKFELPVSMSWMGDCSRNDWAGSHYPCGREMAGNTGSSRWVPASRSVRSCLTGWRYLFGRRQTCGGTSVNRHALDQRPTSTNPSHQIFIESLLINGEWWSVFFICLAASRSFMTMCGFLLDDRCVFGVLSTVA